MEQTFTKAIDLIYLAKQNGIEIILNNDQLQLKLLKNKNIDKTLLNELKDNKNLIIDFLREHIKADKNQNLIATFDRNPTQHIPLSFSQERLWFIDQMEGNVQYHVPAVLRLQGNLNTEALTKALQHIVERHEVLRTTIRMEEGNPYQSIETTRNWQVSLM